MKRKTDMMKKSFKLLLTILTVATLAVLLSGCGRSGQDLEGKNIVTFELSGGTLELKTSSVNTKINYAYFPGTYILDPTEIPGYKMYRQGYDFTGWYTTAECNPEDKWNFDTPFNTETLTLYAGWEKSVKLTYTLFYVEDGESVALGSYDVKAGDTFSDWRGIAEDRKDHTPIGYYSDAEMTAEWDEAFAHPGGETNTDVAVYVKYIVGEWVLVDSLSALRSAINSGKDIYLTGDVDGEGATFNHSSINPYCGVFEGNGFTVSNFKTAQYGSGVRPATAIFKNLGEGAEIRNVNFADVDYDLRSVGSSVNTVKAAALAINANDEQIKVTNVTVSGTLTTSYEGELLKYNSFVYEGDAGITSASSTVDITLDKQN